MEMSHEMWQSILVKPISFETVIHFKLIKQLLFIRQGRQEIVQMFDDEEARRQQKSNLGTKYIPTSFGGNIQKISKKLPFLTKL